MGRKANKGVCPARRGKRCGTHVHTLQCDTGASNTAELLMQDTRKMQTRATTMAATLASLRRRVTKLLKRKPKVAVLKPTQPVQIKALPQDAPSTFQPGHVDGLWTGVMDVDAGDSDMPELCSEYVKDIYAYLMDLEVCQAVRPGYMKDYDITPCMRAKLIDWLIQIHSCLELMQETLYLTVAILDRFLQVLPVSRRRLQLVGVTAMLLASKYEEIRAPTVWEFACLTDDTYTPADILKMEKVMLRALHFELGRPLPLHFLRRASKAANTTTKIHTLAKYLMELTLLDYDMVHYRPSEISAASLCLSQMLLDGLPWTPTEWYYTTYNKAHLKPIMQHIAKNVVVVNEKLTEFQAIKSKYSGSMLMKIALLPELQSPALKNLAAHLLDATLGKIYAVAPISGSDRIWRKLRQRK